MGIKDPIGKKVNFYGDRQIIGVVKNFHFESLHEKVKPFFFKMDFEAGGNILIKLMPGTEKLTIEKIQQVYKEFNPDFPFEYKFLDESYQAQYDAEQRVSTLSSYFARIAIIISCLGLFGLSAFSAERRRKEIGIRKVIGASTIQIIHLLSSEFSRIVLTAVLIALPLSYLVVKLWLEGFAYHIELEWWYFMVAGLIALANAWITVAFQAIKAAIANPIKSLRTE